jgi:ERCC4-type nuclease
LSEHPLDFETFESTADADILIDVHEPLELVESLSKKKKVRVESLPTDIIIPGEPGLAMERKEVSDFFSTFTSDRFADQMRMLKQFQELGWRVALLLEGSVLGEMKRSGMNAIAMQNMIHSVVWGWNIPIYRVEKSDFTATSILYLADKVSGKKSFVAPRKTADRDKPPEEQAAYVAAGLPGVGAKTIDAIRRETSSLFGFLVTMTDDDRVLPNLKSVSEGKRQKIKQVLLADWRIQDASA